MEERGQDDNYSGLCCIQVERTEDLFLSWLKGLTVGGGYGYNSL